MPFARALLETAEAHPDQLAIADAERTLDAAGLVDLAGRVSTLVETLTAEQARDGRAVAPPPEADGVPVIALVIDDAFDLARILAAVMCARAVVTVVDTVWPFAHRIDTVRRAQATLVVTDQPELRDALGEQGGPQTLSVAEFDARAGDSALASIQVRPDDEPFLLLFTSGTTNLPKGFIKNRANWRACIPVSLEHFGAAEGLITQAPGSLAYSLTLYALVEALGTGGGCLVARNFEPFAAAAQLEAGRADRFVGVPAAVHALAVLARRRPEALESLRWAITGGANLSGRMRDEFAAAVPHARLVSYFGAAEIGFIGWSDTGDGTRLRLFDGVEGQVRSPEGERLPYGELGTLFLNAPASCVPGYLASTTDVVLRGEDGWATVGDQARQLDERVVELVGRAGDVVATGGHKVALPEVERALAAVPGADRSCVVAVPHDVLGTELVALLEPAAGPWPPDKADLLARLRDALALQYVPRRFYTVDALPRTASGKVRRGEVTQRVTDDFDGLEGVTRL